MEEKGVETLSLPNTKAKQSELCQECNTNAPKYKCPGCSVRTCSLSCVNSHKKRTDCTGKRPLTDFVPMSEFDDNLLLSDYHMLEEVKRMAESSKRMRTQLCGTNSRFSIPYPLKFLKKVAAQRGVNLMFLPNGMSRRESNRTHYDHSKKFISWSIEWRFHSKTDVVLVDHDVLECQSISSIINNHLQPGPWNHVLKRFCDETPDSLKFLIRKSPKGMKSTYCQLDIHEPISHQFRNIAVVEYPIIHVFLPSQTFDFKVINYMIPKKTEAEEPVDQENIDSKGVTFREEEIEDHGSVDPLVSDLKNHDSPKKESEANDFEDGDDFCLKQYTDIPDIDSDFEPVFIDMDGDEFNFDGLLAEDRMSEGEIEDGEIV